jgi:hypothetical protein
MLLSQLPEGEASGVNWLVLPLRLQHWSNNATELCGTASMASSIGAVDASFLSGRDRSLVRQCLLGPEICHVRHRSAVSCQKLSLSRAISLPIFLLVNQEFNFI